MTDDSLPTVTLAKAWTMEGKIRSLDIAREPRERNANRKELGKRNSGINQVKSFLMLMN